MNMHKSTFFRRPEAGDCAPYYLKYVDLVPEDVEIATFLHTQRDWFGDWIASLTPEQCQFRYADDKWSLAEMIGHVLDCERVFAYRMLAISRNDMTPLPGFEQDDYVSNSIYNEISPEDLADEWKAVRSASILLLRNMNTDMASRTGIANNLNVRVSAIPYIMAGHVVHHYRIGQDRYLSHVAVS